MVDSYYEATLDVTCDLWEALLSLNLPSTEFVCQNLFKTLAVFLIKNNKAMFSARRIDLCACCRKLRSTHQYFNVKSRMLASNWFSCKKDSFPWEVEKVIYYVFDATLDLENSRNHLFRLHSKNCDTSSQLGWKLRCIVCFETENWPMYHQVLERHLQDQNSKAGTEQKLLLDLEPNEKYRYVRSGCNATWSNYICPLHTLSHTSSTHSSNKKRLREASLRKLM